ncbi:hypothetical protein HYH02_006481 [Chlamydomonas schloesseri]|uniref:EF-hand domain-containing protein n=1 Tax=Chlamydomonas schloesseri TaxID=2026947 RepID=A0A835WKQ0_9CHLO|nr:hypothetical protein HYH02_006481 [Chlamydomonas schloesseri]|eukprot:KAG2448590.1 hypothetical protein HYH02_006481 [Chlamydomonas schloesseri]
MTSRSPYNAYLARPGSPGKAAQAALRASAPDGPTGRGAALPPDGALSSSVTVDSGWGLNAMLRSTGGSGTPSPRPPSGGPSPPRGDVGTSKSPMAFRARRFNNGASTNAAQESAASASGESPLPASGSGGADRARRRSGADNAVATSSQSSPSGAPVARQLSASASSASGRPSTSPAGTILAAYANGPGSHSGNSSSGAAGPQNGVLSGAGDVRPGGGTGRPRSSSGNSASTTTSGSAPGAKVLRNRLAEDTGGHAAGTPTLSLREKVVNLQKANKALEQQLAEAAAEAQQRAAQQHEAHEAALAALQQRLAALEVSLLEQQRAAAELAQRNGQLTSSEAELTAQLAEAKRAAAQAASQASNKSHTSHSSSDTTTPTKSLPTVSTPPALGHERSLVDVHASPSGAPGAGAGGDGPHSPRTPLGWDAGAASSPISSSTSSSSTASNGGSGTNQRRVSEDTPPAHPHIRPTSPTEAQQQPGNTTSLRPHTAPHSNYLDRSSSLGSGAPGTPPLGGTSGASGTAAESVLVFSPSEPDCSSGVENHDLRRLNSVPGPGALGVAHTSPCTSGGGGAGAAGLAAAHALEGSALYLAGVGPPPMSPVAAAAGLSGAGVALLAKQKKQIAALRAQLQQKDSAYAFLANEHSELEGQLKEVEAAKREYAARYAFMVLDQDLDGHIRVDQVSSFDMFGCYAPAVLEYAFKHWRFASGFKGYLNMDDFVRFVTLADDRTSKDSQRFWFGVLDLDGDGTVSAEDAKWFYDAVEKDENTFVVSFEDLWHQLLDMTQPAKPRRGFTSSDLWKCKLGAGAIGLLMNHNNMLLHRTTAEWGRGDFPL